MLAEAMVMEIVCMSTMSGTSLLSSFLRFIEKMLKPFPILWIA
jgi:hypothetical protein